MRRNLPVLGLSLSLGLLLWPLPASHSVAVGFDIPKFGRAAAAMGQDERPSALRLTALLQGIRPRACRLTAAPSDALATRAVGFPDVTSIHISHHPAEAAFGHIPAGARTLFPRAPPLSA
jgi:hypothetical protein